MNNFEDLFNKAKEHKKQTFFKVDGQYDHYDNIRASIWVYQNKNRAVSLGFLWDWGLGEKLINRVPTKGYGHMVYAYGWNDKGLAVRNSYGASAGEGGTHYITREVINDAVDKYGAYMFIDLAPSAAKLTWTIWQRIYNWWRKLLARFS